MQHQDNRTTNYKICKGCGTGPLKDLESSVGWCVRCMDTVLQPQHKKKPKSPYNFSNK